MGSGSWSATDWSSFTRRSTAGKSTSAIFASSLAPDLDPRNIKVRESRDSADNPLSTAIIIGADVTGSMSKITDYMIRTGLNTLFTEIYDRKPVTDPHILFSAFGDVEAHDPAPLQATQFEADIRIAEQIKKVWLTNGGGGNASESYQLPWYFAANHTSTDCFEKRKKKGYLFTFGDDGVPPPLRRSQVEEIFGYSSERDYTSADLLAMAERTYEVYHLIVSEGSSAGGRTDQLLTDWTNLMGERAIRLADHTKIAEVIISAIQVNEGMDHGKVAASWDGSTSMVVSQAIRGLSQRIATASGMTRF